MTINDLPTLREEIAHLRRTLTQLRLKYANLLAAVRAAVAADQDGEPDPIAYLRDELPDHPLRPTVTPTGTGQPDGEGIARWRQR